MAKELTFSKLKLVWPRNWKTANKQSPRRVERNTDPESICVLLNPPGAFLSLRGFASVSFVLLSYRDTARVKLKSCSLSLGPDRSGKPKSNAIGTGPIIGTTIRRPKPAVTR